MSDAVYVQDKLRRQIAIELDPELLLELTNATQDYSILDLN